MNNYANTYRCCYILKNKTFNFLAMGTNTTTINLINNKLKKLDENVFKPLLQHMKTGSALNILASRLLTFPFKKKIILRMSLMLTCAVFSRLPNFNFCNYTNKIWQQSFYLCLIDQIDCGCDLLWLVRDNRKLLDFVISGTCSDNKSFADLKPADFAKLKCK